MESPVYSPTNYVYNTNYNREFNSKVVSEGADFIASLRRKPPSTARPSIRRGGTLQASLTRTQTITD